MLLLAAVHVCVMAVWLGFWSTGLGKISEKFNVADWKRQIDTAGGAVLVFFGIRTALPGN